jgi:hypothetical protein
LAEQILSVVNELLTQCGLLLKAGTAVDATLIAAPTSTKNKDKKRDPEMHSSKKGNQWYFGMKAHVGVDGESGLVRGIEALGNQSLGGFNVRFSAGNHVGPSFVELSMLTCDGRVRT